MLMIWVEAATPSDRGHLTRWLSQVTPTLFVGRASGLVRDELWERLCKSKTAKVVQCWSANNEQGFQLRMHGDLTRTIVDLEGLQMICVKDAAWQEAADRFALGSSDT